MNAFEKELAALKCFNECTRVQKYVLFLFH